MLRGSSLKLSRFRLDPNIAHSKPNDCREIVICIEPLLVLATLPSTCRLKFLEELSSLNTGSRIMSTQRYVAARPNAVQLLYQVSTRR